MPLITYREAIRHALAEELERDANVVVMGEEVAQFNGAYKVTEGLLARFGPKRIVDTPMRRAISACVWPRDFLSARTYSVSCCAVLIGNFCDMK